MSEESHYFSPAPGGDGQRQRLQVRLRGRELEVVTAAGVFSGDRVDLGTRVLLREVPDPPSTGDLLDLGCGWGPIALAMAQAAPRARVWAVDVNERALELVRENARALRLAGITAVTPDGVPADVRFSAIWSNPPIRVGKEALHALLLTWLPRLTDDGAAYLVVQRNLGADSLHAWLADTLTGTPGGERLTVTRHGSAKGYRVLRVANSTGS